MPSSRPWPLFPLLPRLLFGGRQGQVSLFEVGEDHTQACLRQHHLEP